MGPLSFMRSVVDGNVVMRRMTVLHVSTFFYYHKVDFTQKYLEKYKQIEASILFHVCCRIMYLRLNKHGRNMQQMTN